MRRVLTAVAVLALGLAGCSGETIAPEPEHELSLPARTVGPECGAGVSDQIEALLEAGGDRIEAKALVFAVSRSTGDWSVLAVKRNGVVSHYVTDSTFYHLYGFPDDVTWTGDDMDAGLRAAAKADQCIKTNG